MLDRLRELVAYRRLLGELVFQTLRARYQGSILGFLWTLLNPTLVYICFTIVFSVLNKWDIRDYGVYFFSGFMAWSFFSNTCLAAADSIVFNAPLVTRANVPKALIPLAAVVVGLVDLAACVVILFVIMLFAGTSYSASLFFLPVSILALTLFVCGASLVCAWWNVVLRDFHHLLGSLMFIWFFFSPILWKMSSLPEQSRMYFQWNPVCPYLAMFQQPIWQGRLPSGGDIAISFALGIGLLVVGLIGFLRAEDRFYYYL